MKQVHWLVEDGPFEEDLIPIITEIKRQGHPLTLVKYGPFESKEYNDLFDPQDCVVFYGSINLACQLQRQTPWIPGAIMTKENYDMLHFVPHWGEHMFNMFDLKFLPWGLAKNNLEHNLKENKKTFIRPNVGTKLFSGQVVSKSSDIQYIDSRCQSHDLVFVSPAIKMDIEYRLFVVDKKIVSGTKYKENGDLEPLVDSYVPQGVIQSAQNILDGINWVPDRCFVMDVNAYIPQNNDDIWNVSVIELNSISTSGWYAADPEPIIREVSRIALEEWKEINEI